MGHCYSIIGPRTSQYKIRPLLKHIGLIYFPFTEDINTVKKCGSDNKD